MIQALTLAKKGCMRAYAFERVRKLLAIPNSAKNTYSTCGKALIALVYEHVPYKISHLFRSKRQYLAPRLCCIKVELDFTPGRKFSCFLHALRQRHPVQLPCSSHTGQVFEVGVPKVLKIEKINAKSLPSSPDLKRVSEFPRKTSAVRQPAAHISKAHP